jgi:hypothetical protein
MEENDRCSKICFQRTKNQIFITNKGVSLLFGT